MILLCHAFALSKTTGWVTINGAHVLIDKIGNIVGGPDNLLGKQYKDAVSETSSLEVQNTGYMKLNDAYADVQNGTIVRGQTSKLGQKVAPKAQPKTSVPFPKEKLPVPDAIQKDPEMKVRAARYKIDGEVKYYKEYLKAPQVKVDYALPPPKAGQQKYANLVEAKNSATPSQVQHRVLITRREADAFTEGVYHGLPVKTK